MDLKWYCAETYPAKEKLALRNVIMQGFETLQITYIRNYQKRPLAVSRPLFPNYIFIRFSLDQLWQTLYSTYGIKRLLSLAPGVPAPFEQFHIDQFLACARDETSQFKGAYEVQINVGTKVEIKDGPLAGYHGVCTWSDQKKVRLLMAMLGGQQITFKLENVVV